MILSKASIDLGSGSGGGGGSSSAPLEGLEDAAPATARPFVVAWEPSTELAMSSSREVAASNLFRHHCQHRLDALGSGWLGDQVGSDAMGKAKDSVDTFL